MPDHLISDLVSTPDGVWFRAGVPDVSKKLRKMLERICTRGYSGGSSYLIFFFCASVKTEIETFFHFIKKITNVVLLYEQVQTSLGTIVFGLRLDLNARNEF